MIILNNALETVKNAIHIPVNVIIRPRGGDFYYNENEVFFNMIYLKVDADHDRGYFGLQEYWSEVLKPNSDQFVVVLSLVVSPRMVKSIWKRTVV